jgi:hypothetical protein
MGDSDDRPELTRTETLSDGTSQPTVDEMVEDTIARKYAPVAALLRLMKIAALDCAAFRSEQDAFVCASEASVKQSTRRRSRRRSRGRPRTSRRT